MATVFAATESSVLLDGTPIEGVQSVEYRMRQERHPVYQLNSTERVGVVAGASSVEGRIRVASRSSELESAAMKARFDLLVTFGKGPDAPQVAFNDCVLTDKTFELSVSGRGEAVYAFSAVRMSES
jgi:hypothetical protein